MLMFSSLIQNQKEDKQCYSSSGIGLTDRDPKIFQSPIYSLHYSF